MPQLTVGYNYFQALLYISAHNYMQHLDWGASHGRQWREPSASCDDLPTVGRIHVRQSELVNYSVLLSFPNNTSNPNMLQLLNAKNELLYNSHSKQEPPLTPGEDDPNVAPSFNAYSGSGKTSVSLIFVNKNSQWWGRGVMQLVVTVVKVTVNRLLINYSWARSSDLFQLEWAGSPAETQ